MYLIGLHENTSLPEDSVYTFAPRRTKLALDGTKSGDGLFGRKIIHEAVDRAEFNQCLKSQASITLRQYNFFPR